MSKQPKRTVTKFFFLSTLALALIIPTLFAGASTTSSSLSSSPTLKIEDTNPSVLLLQQYLNNNGYVVNEIKGEPGSIGNETTKFGLKTKQALIRFQKDHNITPADGIFGPITKAKTLEVATTLTGDTSGGAVLGVAMTSSMSGGTVPFYQTSSVTLNIKGQGSGSITSSPDGLACSGNNKVCQLTSPSLPQPTSFVFRATPNDNTTIFDNWAGDCPSTSINNLLRDMCTVSLIPGGHRNIEAYFKVGRQHTLTIVNDIPAGNQSSVITESNISQSGTSGGSSGNSYYEGSIVTLAPWLSGNVEFLGFTGDGLSSNGLSNAATTVTMDADKVITFHVRNKSQHTLTLLTNTGDGEGSITINGQPVTSNQTFSDGDVVTLTGTANVGSKVGSWFVNGMSVAATYAVGQSLVPDQTTSVDITMNQDINVGLPFNIARLSVSKGGTGSGNVTINPYTSAYGSSLPSGSVRVLTATANANSTFDGFIDPWGGYHDSPYTLTTGDMETAITAVFTAKATDPTPVTVIATTTPTTTPAVVDTTTLATTTSATSTLPTPVVVTSTTTSSTTPVVVVASTTPIITTPGSLPVLLPGHSDLLHSLTITTSKALSTFIKNVTFFKADDKNKFTKNTTAVLKSGQTLNLYFSSVKDNNSLGLYKITNRYLEDAAIAKSDTSSRLVPTRNNILPPRSINNKTIKTPYLDAMKKGICDILSVASSLTNTLGLPTPAGWPQPTYTTSTTETWSAENGVASSTYTSDTFWNTPFLDQIIKNSDFHNNKPPQQFVDGIKTPQDQGIYNRYLKALANGATPATVKRTDFGNVPVPGGLVPTPMSSSTQSQLNDLFNTTPNPINPSSYASGVDCDLETYAHASHISSISFLGGQLHITIDNDLFQGAGPGDSPSYMYTPVPTPQNSTTFILDDTGQVAGVYGAEAASFWMDQSNYAIFTIHCYTIVPPNPFAH